MENDKNKPETVNKNAFFAVLLLECILAATIVLSALSLKLFFHKSYKAAKEWYGKNITVDTDISEIIKGANDEI